MMKRIRTVITVSIIALSAYFLGTANADTVTEIRETEKGIEVIPEGYMDMTSSEFIENYVDMREVTHFEISDDGLQLYMADGTGYYWE